MWRREETDRPITFSRLWGPTFAGGHRPSVPSVHRTVYRKRCLLVAILLALSAGLSAPLWAQNAYEADVGVGYTSVNRAGWLGYSPTEWNETDIPGDVQAFLLHVGPVALGAEVGYQRFFWYLEPNGYGGYRGADISAWHVSALARIGLAYGLFAETGAGIQFFPGGTDASVTGSLGYMITVSKNFLVPIKLRADLVLDKDANMLPFGLTVGLAYRPSK